MKRLFISLCLLAAIIGYWYGRRVERVAWQMAVYGTDGNAHTVLMQRVLDKLSGK